MAASRVEREAIARLLAAKAEAAEAKRDAAAKRISEQLQVKRQAAAAEAEAKRKASETGCNGSQQVKKAPSDAEATKTEQERKAALERRPQYPQGQSTANEGRAGNRRVPR